MVHGATGGGRKRDYDMMPELEIGFCRRIIPSSQKLHDISYSALPDGSLAILRARTDFLTIWQNNLKKGLQGKSLSVEGERGFLFIYDGLMEWPVLELPLESPFPLMDQNNEGRWIFAGSDARYRSHNACILSSSGKLLQHINLGQAVQHVQYDEEDMIWTGYFDQGFYKKLQYAHETFSMTGLLRFNSSGRPVWGTPKPIMDCYALNVFKNTAWVYHHPEFQIIEFSYSGIESVRNTDIRGARAIAVNMPYVLLGSGYGSEFDRVVLVRLDDEKAVTLGQFSLNLREPGKLKLSYFGGRGPFLHFVWDDLWIRLHVEEVRQWFC